MSKKKYLKPVVFTDSDDDILKFIENKTFSTYVKYLIRKEMNRADEEERTLANIQNMLLKVINSKGTITTEDVVEATTSQRCAINRIRNFTKNNM